jgi:hypothetical protein
MGENHAARPHPEHVVLEIGGELGALIVYTEPALHGAEIEISRQGDGEHREHRDVLERLQGGRPSFAVVFDRLKEGAYTLWLDDTARARDVVVAGGQVAELDWSTAG